MLSTHQQPLGHQVQLRQQPAALSTHATYTALGLWATAGTLTLGQTTTYSRIRGVAGSRHDQASLSLTE